MDIFTLPAGTFEVFIKLSIAIILGMIIGIERVLAHKTAGMRTYALVSMGSALFILVAGIMSPLYVGLGIDPLRMASQIVVGVGFLGAGVIILKDARLQGLTTASGLWVAAGIGMAAGFGLYAVALIATLLTLFIFVVIWFVEDRIIKKIPYKNEPPLNDIK